MESKTKKLTKKPIVIRQTKASIFRMAKANPLLVEKDHITVADKNVFLPPAVVGRRLTIADLEFAKLCKENAERYAQDGKLSVDACATRYNQPSKISKSWVPSTNIVVKQEDKQKQGNPKMVKSMQYDSQNKKPDLNVKQKLEIKKKQEILHPAKNKDKLLGHKNSHDLKSFSQRNSFVSSTPLQSQHLKAACKNVLLPTVLSKNTEKSQQIRNNVSNPKLNGNNSTVLIKKNEITQECNVKRKPALAFKAVENNAQFKKPFDKVNNSKPHTLRRSISSQHLNSFTNRRSFVSSTPVTKQFPDTVFNRLQQPLKDWLKRKNKSLSNFHHLKCFGLHHLSAEARDEVKENIEIGFVRSPSYESLNIPQNINEEERKDKEAFDENIVKGAIEDIYNLIIAGYSTEQCEAWLNFIRQKHKKTEEQAQYWECRAEIEQSRGNISTAIEAYKNSIINGANVQHIDDSLGQLLDKFSVLNIDAGHSEKTDRNRKEKEEVRNIFKSTIIQFAIKERSRKEKSKGSADEKTVFIATPVRRSTRKSCSKFQNTPGKSIVNSLNDLEESVKENLKFETNSYLT